MRPEGRRATLASEPPTPTPARTQTGYRRGTAPKPAVVLLTSTSTQSNHRTASLPEVLPQYIHQVQSSLDVIVTATVRAQLTRWILELENPEHEGVPFGAARAFPGAADPSALAIYADAALECANAGFCAWTVVDDELVYVQGEWTAEERRVALICDLELAASTFGLVALAPESGRSFVYSFTDNVNAKAAMRSATPKTELMQTFCGARVEWLIANRVAEAAERITSAANLWADLGSRGRLADMLAQAQALGLSTRRVPVPPGWRDRAHPSRDASVLAWLESRAKRAEELGHSDDEIAERWATLFALGMYIDDSGLISIDDLVFDVDGEPVMRDGVQMRRAAMHFQVLKASMHELGIDTCKEQPPSEDLELLGVALSLREQRMRLAPGKRVKYAAMALDVAQRKVVERETLLELLGRLNFAATFYPMGRQWLHAPWRAVRAQYRTANGDVIVTATVRAQLTRWILELENPEHEGVPFGAARAFPGAADPSALAIYADAALECADAGFCAWTVVDDELVYVQGEWTAEERRVALICDLELAASTFGLVALAPESGRSFVYSFTDNVNAKAAMRSATPKTELMQTFCGARVEWLIANRVAEAAERITSAANLWADLGSRGKLAEMLAQAHALGLSTRRVPVPPGWREMLSGVSRGPGSERGTEGDRHTPSPTPPLIRAPSPRRRRRPKRAARRCARASSTGRWRADRGLAQRASVGSSSTASTAGARCPSRRSRASRLWRRGSRRSS